MGTVKRPTQTPQQYQEGTAAQEMHPGGVIHPKHRTSPTQKVHRPTQQTEQRL